MLSSISPVLLLIRKAFWEFLYGKADVLSPYAAHLVIKRATLRGTWE